MGDRVNHDIKNNCGENTVSADEGEERLSLPADTDLSLSVVVTDVFAKSRVFDQNAKGVEAQFRIVRDSRGSVCMLEEIR